MLRKEVILIIALLLFPCLTLAQNDELFDYHSLDLELLITNDFEIKPTDKSYYIDYVSAELTWYPREDYRQEVDYITTDPGVEIKGEQGLMFEWKQPSQTSFSIREESRITVKNEFKRVSKKVGFPIKDLDPAYFEYLEPQEMIDINDEIRQIASSIVQGENDLYTAVFKLAEWVENNVEYELSTLTAEATQKASWVLENKKGVCDELTSLFISMCRSLGIPARFVMGLSYSDINSENKGWDLHGWAEVYFPGFGWIPFDVTYKELGFVGTTHIKLKTTLDSREVSINYATRSRNTQIKPDKLEFDVDVLKHDYKLKHLVELKTEVVEPETGFGSYNLLTLDIKNPHSYYVTTRISLASINGLEILDKKFKSVLLAPYEEKKLYWMLRVKSNLELGYIYTFPLKITASRGEQAETSFRVAKQGTVYSKEYMSLFMVSEEPEQKLYSKNVMVNCSLSKEKIYLNESVNISCVVDNRGVETLRKLSVCLDDECGTSRLPRRGIARFEYTKKFDTLGAKTLVFGVENELVKKAYYTTIEVQDKPLLEIINISFPQSISYEELSEIKFFVKKKSHTNPKDVNMRVEHALMDEEWDVPILDKDYEFTVLLRGEYLKLNKNDFKIIITYDDEKGNEYKTQKEFSIDLNNPTFLQKVMIWLNILDHKISGWINNI